MDELVAPLPVGWWGAGGTVAFAVLAFVVVALVVALVAVYRRQLVSRLTHWTGPPARTTAYLPHAHAPSAHLAVVGDTGRRGRRLTATGTAIARIGATSPYDALLLLGDVAYPSGDPRLLAGTVFGPFGAVLDQGADLLAVLGNHDVRRGHGDALVRALGMPGRRWARTYRDVLVVGLDSNSPDDDAQRAFLERTLAAADVRWKIVAVHHPPYSAGYQGSDERVRAAFAPVFERHRVHLVLSGHDHDYQRSVPVGGVTYVVTGGAARSRRTGRAPFTAVSFGWHHFVDVAAFDDRLVVRAVGRGARVADEVVLVPSAAR